MDWESMGEEWVKHVSNMGHEWATIGMKRAGWGVKMVKHGLNECQTGVMSGWLPDGEPGWVKQLDVCQTWIMSGQRTESKDGLNN